MTTGTITPFKDHPYYHASIRKLIIAFGMLFTDITVIRKNTSGDNDQVIRIPIAYGPRHKWLERIKAQPDFQENVQITLPRIAFEITGYQYDPSRKIGTQGNYLAARLGDANTKLFNPVPYDINIQLHSMCKSQEDSLQILEQIAPYFAPSMTVAIEILPQFSIKKDIPIVLNNIQVEDSYEGSPQDQRIVIQTFNFVAQMDLFGPLITSKKVIKHSIADIGFNPKTPIDLADNNDYRYHADVNPESANKEDSHVIDESWFGFD